MQIETKRIAKDEIHQFTELIRLFEDVFEMKDFIIPSQSHLQQLLDKEDFFAFVALSDGKVVGGLTTYTLHQYYSERPLVYIYDLAVKREFQRRGIGKTLIDSLNKYRKGIGVEEVFVQADEVDAYALDFYRSTGARGEKVVHFYYPLR
jgi:aminoglycoside 3-N-acetyltransferase I